MPAEPTNSTVLPAPHLERNHARPKRLDTPQVRCSGIALEYMSRRPHSATQQGGKLYGGETRRGRLQIGGKVVVVLQLKLENAGQ